jgi:hypothetical protein
LRAQNLEFRRSKVINALGETAEFEGTEEDAREHRTIEAASIGVAQRGVIAAEEGDVVGQRVLGPVGEGVGGAALDHGFVQQVGEVAIPGDLAEADDDADLGERCDLRGEVRRAVANLLRGGLVAGRGAADYGADPYLPQLETVVAADGGGFAGQTEFVEDGVHEIAGSVAGKGTAGAVGSMGAGSETEDEDAGVGIAEAGNGPGPVFLVAVGFAAGLADATDIGDEARTTGAVGDVLLDLTEDGEGRLWNRPLGAHGRVFLETG